MQAVILFALVSPATSLASATSSASATATSSASATSLATAGPESKPSFLQRTPYDPKIHEFGFSPGFESDDAPIMPKMRLKDSIEDGEVPGVPQHVVEWKKSELPLALQWSLAGVWILMLGSLPFLIPFVDHRPVTKTQTIVGALMLLVLFGGFYLFTNIILFQSIHFKQIRPLTIVECIYFMTQVITTVGYGDITPAKTRGQVFVGFYVLGAIFVISMLISDLTKHMVRMAKRYREKLATEQGTSVHKKTTIGNIIEKEKPAMQGLLVALAVFAALDLCWIVFFALHPGEGKTFFQAVYMSVITLSTVGFGWFTPVTETGMIFASFFMLFGSAALVNVIGNFTELMVKMNEWERFRPESKSAVLDSLDNITEGSETVTEAQFYQFALLQMNCVSQPELDHIRAAFQQLNPKKGIVTTKAIHKSMAVEDNAEAAKMMK